MKTLKEVYGYTKIKKLGLDELTRLITENEDAANAPKGVKFTDQANFKDFDDAMIDELFAQLKTKDMSQPIYQAMWNPDPEKVTAWLASKGEDTVRERIKAVGSKIPASGLPKSEMPFLPGPKDAKGSVEDVVDALTPGGDMTIDFQESVNKSRWASIAGISSVNEVAPPAKNTLKPGSEEADAYLKSGLPSNDGNPADDNANVSMPAQVAAADAVPTQSNILLPKALGMAAMAGIEGGDLGAYLSTDNEILDGHHRWAATMLNNPAASLGGFAAIDLKAMGGTQKALKHLTALGNALGNKTKTK